MPEEDDLTPTIEDADYEVRIPYEIRDQHVFIPGKTRMGKTTLMHRMIMGDIENKAGVAVLDPKGDLVKDLLHSIPQERVDDTIYLDLKTPVPLDFMGHGSDPEMVVSDLKYIVTKNDPTLTRADSHLIDLIYSLIAVPGTCFLDIYRFAMDPIRRDEILAALEKKDPALWSRWKYKFPPDKEWEPVTNRMTKFVRNPSLAAIFGDPNPRLNIPRAMNERKIILVDLSGASEAKEIYGSLLVSQFQLAAFRRSELPAHLRVPYFLYVDEFENFQTAAFDKILSMAGGYGLRFVLGAQFLDQLEPRIRSSIFGNVGSFIVFKIGDHDTHYFKSIVHPYEHSTLAQLQKHQAMYKVGDDAPIYKWTQPPLPEPRDDFADKILANTIANYASSARNAEKEPGEKHPCNTAQVSHDGSNEQPHGTTRARTKSKNRRVLKDDTIEPN